MTRLALVFALALAGTAAASPARVFEVVAAPRAPAVGNAQALFRPDDPQLVGRLIETGGRVPTFDGDGPRCAGATVVTARMTVARLVRELFPPRPSGGLMRATRPAELGVSLAPGATVAVTRVRCPRAGGTRASYLVAALFPAGGGRWGYWRTEAEDHLLLLRAAGAIRPSFACARARSVSERAICADRALAGWDASVAAAYREGQGDAADQRAWLAERDKCAADRACLHESMSLRTYNLLR